MVMLAEDFIRLVPGDRWLPMTGVLQVLCLLGFLRGVSNLVAPLHLAAGMKLYRLQRKLRTLAGSPELSPLDR